PAGRLQPVAADGGLGRHWTHPPARDGDHRVREPATALPASREVSRNGFRTRRIRPRPGRNFRCPLTSSQAAPTPRRGRIHCDTMPFFHQMFVSWGHRAYRARRMARDESSCTYGREVVNKAELIEALAVRLGD